MLRMREDLIQLVREIVPGLSEADYAKVTHEALDRVASDKQLIKTSSKRYETTLISTILDVLDQELFVTAKTENYMPSKIVVTEEELESFDVDKLFRDLEKTAAKDEELEEMTPKTEREYDEAARSYIDPVEHDEEGLWNALAEEHERQAGDMTAEMNKGIKRHKNDFSTA
jgi:hypothetical protein